MAEFVKETVTTHGLDQTSGANTVSTREATGSQTIEYLIYFFFGALEVLLSFRLILKLMGASVSSGFVSFIYTVTGVFILPFEGIFRRGFTQGLETTSILEPATIVAIIVYAALVWGIVKLVQVLSGEKQ